MNNTELKLEINSKFVKDAATEELARKTGILMTPPIGKDYWMFRVDVGHDQAVVGFPKFMTIGIGFQKEEADWNTNLPYRCEVNQIYNHIKHNKTDGPLEKDCIQAIRMIQEAAAQYMSKQANDS